VLLVLMYAGLSLSYWVAFLLAIPAAGFLARIFIIQHDCGHAHSSSLRGPTIGSAPFAAS
jgi:fatty acid desaturase